MSISTQIDRIKNAVETAYAMLKDKGATVPEQQTLDNLPACIDSIFSAFFCDSHGSGGTIQTYTQVPFEPDIVMMSIRWGNSNDVMVNKSVFTVLVKPGGYNRYREKISSTGTPQERDKLTTITSEADGNGTYTVKICCNGSTFPSGMDYMCMLGKSKE